MITYLKFINPFKRYSGALIATGICSFLYVAFNAISLWLVAPVLKIIFLPNQTQQAPVPLGGLSGLYESVKYWTWEVLGGNTDPSHMLPRLCIALIIVFIIKNTFAYGQLHFASFVEQRMIKDLREAVFAHVSKLPYRYFDKRPTGEVMSSVMNDVSAISITFQRVFTQVSARSVYGHLAADCLDFNFMGIDFDGFDYRSFVWNDLSSYRAKSETEKRADSKQTRRADLPSAGIHLRCALGQGFRNRTG